MLGILLKYVHCKVHIDITVQASLTKTSIRGKRKNRSHLNGDRLVLKSKNTHYKLWYVYTFRGLNKD